MNRRLRRLCAAFGLSLLAAPVSAKEVVLVAVAANFAEVLTELKPLFEARHTDAELRISVGSTGKLYAQIRAGAPFDVLMAADQARADRLEAEGGAVAGSRFTYAQGRLALWSADEGRVTGPEVLTAPDTRFVAIANPDLAPYGLAARQTFAALGIADKVQGKLVMGQNAGQTVSMVATGNADLGMVPLAAVLSPHITAAGSHWVVPANLYDPIRQDAVLLDGANAAAAEFLAFLKRGEARSVIARYGYFVPEQSDD